MDRRFRNVPDPSATIPDFGPRADVRIEAEQARVKRLPTGDVDLEAAQRAAVDALDPAPPGSTNALLLVIIGVLVAVIAGGLGFFAVIFAGFLVWAVVGV